MKVDFYKHGLTETDAAGIAEVLKTPFLTTGPVAHGVEDQLRRYFDVPHAALVNSWTNGAVATLLAMGVGPGDEVLVPAETFVASANVVELIGGTARLVDVDPDTLLLTPETAAAAVTERTKAVMPVHLYGRMVDIAALRDAIEAAAAPGQRIYILEDCAHCFEGKLDGDRPGAHSDAAIFSFYATKNVTCGEGGAVILRDDALHGSLLETRLHGMSATAIDRFKGGKYNHWGMEQLGVKANLPDLLAALLPRQIETIDELLSQRHALAGRYRAAFDGTGLRMPAIVEGATDAAHLFTIGVNERDRVIAILNNAGISVTVNFRALPDLGYYAKKYPESLAACPAAVAWGRQTISLPFYPGMPQAHQDHVIETVLQIAASPEFQLL
ncbi:DegT/DnrJ/EryC1/StrS aminotransferase [Notoacmeibacter marinus]|uniref:DegT/DnrJ/EryC1/StrS aminotransferase n=1 Tax=Notoacmeibacter marinus TaxID=1876515 RepID=A0A231V379_9HYPH|nr:DegT/DnrJ/EryC1/StrS family aminotransferase [Notoacmeibacter marinus]OXT02645.1 DegT/DnrJ/EryC1/StrS aminotransferase [Notoacmeibacter marinus]